MAQRTALVAGALGITGRAVLEHLERDPSWNLIAMTRRKPDFPTRARLLPVDLTDAADTRAKIGALSEVTHVFYCAFLQGKNFAEEIAPNMAMLANLLDALEPAATNLAHVQLMHGAKWYGMQLGTLFPTPAREDDPRHIPPNFYFDQQDWLVERRRGKAWSWSTIRPLGIWGPSVDSYMNMINSFAVFASTCKALGLPLQWPGHPGTFDRMVQICDTATLGHAMAWTATEPRAADMAFNVTNGDVTRWRRLWPKVSAFFDMQAGPPRPLKLSTVMADKEPLWAELVKRHGLRPYTIARLSNWAFPDYAWWNDFDQVLDTNRLRLTGFPGFRDTEATITDQLRRLRDDRIIP